MAQNLRSEHSSTKKIRATSRLFKTCLTYTHSSEWKKGERTELFSSDIKHDVLKINKISEPKFLQKVTTHHSAKYFLESTFPFNTFKRVLLNSFMLLDSMLLMEQPIYSKRAFWLHAQLYTSICINTSDKYCNMHHFSFSNTSGLRGSVSIFSISFLVNPSTEFTFWKSLRFLNKLQQNNRKKQK